MSISNPLNLNLFPGHGSLCHSCQACHHYAKVGNIVSKSYILANQRTELYESTSQRHAVDEEDQRRQCRCALIDNDWKLAACRSSSLYLCSMFVAKIQDDHFIQCLISLNRVAWPDRHEWRVVQVNFVSKMK